MITPRKQPNPGRFENSEITPIADQLSIDLFVGRDFGIDREIDQAKGLCDKRHSFAGRCFLNLREDGLPLSGELPQWMIMIRTLPTPGGGKLPKFAAFHFEYEHSAGRPENQKVLFPIRIVTKTPADNPLIR